ncbi:MAG: Fpg/Nei family DNA glycosylase [Geminicoccaceae bacterium]
MPELPDISAYVDALRDRVIGREVRAVRRKSAFFVRTADPPVDELVGRQVEAISRLGKRIAFRLSGDLWAIIHLMIAGRLQWRPPDAPLTNRIALAAIDFDDGSLVIMEAGSKKRASLHVVRGAEAASAFEPGGLDLFEASPQAFKERLTATNHTLKRALTDPRILDGIGNAYSDEILHASRLSPLAMSQALTDEEIFHLHQTCRTVLRQWIDRLCAEAAVAFPTKVTAFRPEMAVHGKFGRPCPVCATAIQRIRYASNETNYCPRCQTEGRVLADRGLSRLLKKDWPKSIEELEAKLPTKAP